MRPGGFDRRRPTDLGQSTSREAPSWQAAGGRFGPVCFFGISQRCVLYVATLFFSPAAPETA
eukprot:2462434-Alexandrium_andersonii.AAC.1